MCKKYKETTLKLSKYPLYIVTATYRSTNCRWLVAS